MPMDATIITLLTLTLLCRGCVQGMDSPFFLTPVKMIRPTMDSYCKDHNGRSITINTKSKLESVLAADKLYHNNLISTTTLFIGLNITSSNCSNFTWVTGEPMTWSNWDEGAGEPQDCNEQKCVKLKNTYFRTASCANDRLGLCEYVTPTHESTTTTYESSTTSTEFQIATDESPTTTHESTTTSTLSPTSSHESRITTTESPTTIHESTTTSTLSPTSSHESRITTSESPTTIDESTTSAESQTTDESSITTIESPTTSHESTTTSIMSQATTHESPNTIPETKTTPTKPRTTNNESIIEESDITTPVPTSDPTTTRIATNISCIRRQRNGTKLSQDELQSIITELKAELAVIKNNTSTYRRKRISVYESKPSSMVIGGVASIIMSVVIGWIIVPDFVTMCVFLCKYLHRT